MMIHWSTLLFFPPSRPSRHLVRRERRPQRADHRGRQVLPCQRPDDGVALPRLQPPLGAVRGLLGHEAAGAQHRVGQAGGAEVGLGLFWGWVWCGVVCEWGACGGRFLTIDRSFVGLEENKTDRDPTEGKRRNACGVPCLIIRNAHALLRCSLFFFCFFFCFRHIDGPCTSS